MKQKKNGYTLIEVIICVALIAVIGTIFTVTLHKKKDNEKNELIEEQNKEVNTAIDILSSNLLATNELKYYEDKENVKNSFFCISKNKLLESGLITADNHVLSELSDDTYIKVVKDKNGLYVMEKSVDIDSCKYLSSSTSTTAGSSEEKTDGDLKNKGYQLKHKISSSASGEENHYDYTLSFDLITGDLIENLMNVYTVFVIDGSGSMDSTFSTARDAAIELSGKLLESDSTNINNYVAALTFSGLYYDLNRNPIDSETDFLRRQLVSTDFEYGAGSTFYYAAFEGAFNKLNEVKANKEKNKYFVIFLTDGNNFTGGTHDDYSSELNKLKNFLKDDKIEYGKLIAVGYNYSGYEQTLVDISSDGCSGSEKKCFYNSSTNKIMDTFNEFLKLIQNEINCYYDAAKITINLADDFYVAGSTKQKIEKELTFDCKKSPYYEELKKFGNKLFDGTEEIYFKRQIDDNSETGDVTVPIIKNIVVNMQKKDETGNLKDIGDPIEIKGDNFSKITLHIEEVKVVN